MNFNKKLPIKKKLVNQRELGVGYLTEYCNFPKAEEDNFQMQKMAN